MIFHPAGEAVLAGLVGKIAVQHRYIFDAVPGEMAQCNGPSFVADIRFGGPGQHQKAFAPSLYQQVDKLANSLLVVDANGVDRMIRYLPVV